MLRRIMPPWEEVPEAPRLCLFLKLLSESLSLDNVRCNFLFRAWGAGWGAFSVAAARAAMVTAAGVTTAGGMFLFCKAPLGFFGGGACCTRGLAGLAIG